mmetsp:Transcript_109757/g.310511  ORF Transcript_109757/g.310511 Transcript_109757/m.310511 type:complete len:262 (+) Transcript_109757:824-1609(+)
MPPHTESRVGLSSSRRERAVQLQNRTKSDGESARKPAMFERSGWKRSAITARPALPGEAQRPEGPRTPKKLCSAWCCSGARTAFMPPTHWWTAAVMLGIVVGKIFRISSRVLAGKCCFSVWSMCSRSARARRTENQRRSSAPATSRWKVKSRPITSQPRILTRNGTPRACAASDSRRARSEAFKMPGGLHRGGSDASSALTSGSSCSSCTSTCASFTSSGPGQYAPHTFPPCTPIDLMISNAVGIASRYCGAMHCAADWSR